MILTDNLFSKLLFYPVSHRLYRTPASPVLYASFHLGIVALNNRTLLGSGTRLTDGQTNVVLMFTLM